MITDIREYDLRLLTEVMLQDLKEMVMTGNATSTGQFDGFQRLIKTGYTNSNGQRCELMDSIVIDWKSNDFNQGTGATRNGTAIVGASGFDLIDVLHAVFQQIRQRIAWAPALAAQNMGVGDMIIMAPQFILRCLLDAFTCWSVCPGKQYNEANLNTYEARNYRRSLDGGMFGNGRIYLDGMEIPLLAYDWGTITTRVS